MNNKKKCFVIMPFSKAYSLTKEQWTEIFEHTIKPAVKECGFGYNCERYEFRRTNITKDILQELNSAHLVIADLTGKNHNVLWELGVRHVLSRRTILIAQDKKFLPSDLKDYPIILYKYKQTPAEVDKFRDDIKKKLEDIETDPDKPDSPVADFLEVKNRDVLSSQKSENYKKLVALISQLSYNLRKIDLVLDSARKNRKVRKTGKGVVGGVDARLDTTGLDLLLSTLYISLAGNLLSRVIACRDVFLTTNAKLDCWHEVERAEGIDDQFTKFLPKFKKELASVLKNMNKIMIDYINNNYQEPEEPTIVLASPEHEKYLKLAK